MRIAIVDPLSYTPPYDDALAAALARRGHDVTLLAGPFLHGAVPEPVGYVREEVFLPVSGRLFRPLPRARLRLLLKGVEYVPSARRLLGRLSALEPDVVHVQWLPRPELDRRWVRRLRGPSVLTAHDVMPRRARARAVWPGLLGWFGRVVVHSQQAEARLVVAGDPLDPVEPVRALASELGVAERIEWRLRFLPDEEVVTLMEDAAVVVLPYRQHDSSGVLATAIGYGRPVVVTDVGSLGEVVRGFGAGKVVPPDDEAALAQACNELLLSSRPPRRRGLAAPALPASSGDRALDLARRRPTGGALAGARRQGRRAVPDAQVPDDGP